MHIEFWVFDTPVPQGSFRHIGNGRIISANPKLDAWRKMVATAAREATSARLITDPVEVVLHFSFIRPKSVKREFMTVKPDTDKLIRSCLDAISLERYVQILKDDSQVIKITATKSYGDINAMNMQIITN